MVFHYPVSLYCRVGVFMRECVTTNMFYKNPLLSELSEIQKNINRQEKTSISESPHGRSCTFWDKGF